MNCTMCTMGKGEHAPECMVGKHEMLIGQVMDKNNYPSYQYRPTSQMGERARARTYARMVATQVLRRINETKTET